MLVARVRFADIIDHRDYLRKVRGAIQFDCMYTVFVIRNHFIKIIHSRVKYVAIHSETVRDFAIVRWDSGTKAEKVDFLVSIVELQDLTDLLDYL